MNVSMQDGFNLGWKLGAVVTGLADAAHQELSLIHISEPTRPY